MQIVSIVNQVGPLPINVNFSVPEDVPIDGPVVVVVTGSGYSTSPNVLIGFTVNVDGTQIAQATVFSNAPDTHRVASPQFAGLQLSPGPHTCEIDPATGDTVTDANDTFAVQVLF